MQEIFGTRGHELVAYGQQNPLHMAAGAPGVTSIVLTLAFGRLSSSGDGSDSSGSYFGGGDGSSGD